MRKVIIAGNFDFPTGNAAGKRVLGLGYIFRSLGYSVYYVGCLKQRSTKDILETKSSYEGFEYYCFNGNRDFKTIIDYKTAACEFERVTKTIGINDSDIVVLYGSPTISCWMKLVIRYLKKKKIKVLFDCVDWIERTGEKNIIKNIIKYLDINYRLRVLVKRCDGVICISTFLQDYYKRKRCTTIVIPPVGKMYISDFKECHHPIKLFYAGGISKGRPVNWSIEKDRLDLTISILFMLYKTNDNFVFDVYGITEDEYISAKPDHRMWIENELADVIHFHGRTSNEIVCEKLREADVMILNREITKVTTSGFPSKVAESLNNGIPVITNDTSDVSDYIINDKNGWVLSFEIDEAINYMSALFNNSNRITAVKRICNEESIFDYRIYVEPMKRFLTEIY